VGCGNTLPGRFGERAFPAPVYCVKLNTPACQLSFT
jgi:hypothetical protein